MSELASERIAGLPGSEDVLAPEDFQVLLGSISEGVTVRTPDGRIVYANEAAARLLGVDSPAEVVSSPMGKHRERFEIYDAAGRPLAPSELPGERARLGGEETELLVRFRPVGGG